MNMKDLVWLKPDCHTPRDQQHTFVTSINSHSLLVDEVKNGLVHQSRVEILLLLCHRSKHKDLLLWGDVKVHI